MKEEFLISQHKLVPKQVVVSKEEAKTFLEKQNLTIAQLPKISRKDAALVDLEVSVGDVIKIARKSDTAGETVYFRVVVND